MKFVWYNAVFLFFGVFASATSYTPSLFFTFEDRGEGGQTIDSAPGTPVAATLNPGASVVFDAARNGYVLNTNAAGAYVPANASTFTKTSQISGSFTLSFWVNAVTYWTQQWTPLVGHCDSGTGLRVFTMNSSALADFQTTSSGWDPSFAWHGNEWSAGGWHHLALVYDAAGQVAYAYRDGVLDTTKNKAGTPWQGSGIFQLGGGTTRWLLDDVAIIQQALSQSEIQALVNGSSNIITKPHLTDPLHCNLYIDNKIDIKDLLRFAEQWLNAGCIPPDPMPANWRCADWNESQRVDYADFIPCAQYWLTSGLADPCNPGPTAQIQNLYTVPTITVDNAEWLLTPGYSNYYPNPPYLADFAAAGTRLFDIPTTPADWTNSIPTVWTGPSSWNYNNLDDYFTRLITASPDGMIIPRLYLLMPRWWLDDPAHAAEMEVMDDGTSQSTSYSQFSSNPGILPYAGPFPSLASEVWRQAMAYAIEHYIDHIQAQGYMGNVIGFELSGLGTEEWYHWSSNRSELAGYSVPTRNAFRNWLRQKYNNDVAALRTAWSNSSITFDSVSVPSRADRKAYEGARTFRDPATSMHVVDFYQFYNDLIPDTISYFAQVIKNKTGNNKLVGAFYAYMNEFQGYPEFGHNALNRYNQSPYLDYVYVTSSYFNRGPGGADLLRAPAYSTQLHNKLWYVSNDTATIETPHVWEDYGFGWDAATVAANLANLGYTDTLEKNIWTFKRAAGMNTAMGFYQNYLDLHAGYYRTPELMDAVEMMNQFYDSTKNYPRTSNSEILVVSDEFSCNYACVGPSNWNNNLLYYSLTTPRLALQQLGAPADHILLSDLALVDAARYKMIIFLNCWNMTTAQRAAVDAFKNNDRLLVFCYAPGLFNNQTQSSSNMSAVCGITLTIGSETLAQPRITITADHVLGQNMQTAGVGTFGPNASICKRIYVSDASASKLGYDPAVGSSRVVMAIKSLSGWKSIYSVTSDIPASALREMARYAGMHIYNSQNDTLYVNNSYVTVHANGAGSRTINWPRPVTLYDAMTNAPLASGVTSHTRSYQHGETYIYRYE